MNTPAHLILGMAVFAKTDQRKVLLPVLAGSFLPDLSLYAMTAWAIQVQGISPRVVFNELYFSDSWQSVFAVDNSFILWGLVLAAALLFKLRWLVLLSGAAVLHLLCDFPLHNDDARQQFWPLTDWVFHSPLSYWDNTYHANIIGPLEMALCVGCAVILWRRFQTTAGRALVVGLTVIETLPGIMWALML